MRLEQFATPDPVQLRVKIPAGDIRVQTHDSPMTDVQISGDNETLLDRIVVDHVNQAGRDVVSVELRDGSLFSRWRGGDVDVSVKVPDRASLELSTASADVRADGGFEAVSADTASGEVAVDRADEVSIKTASGDVRVGTVSGVADVKTASGDITCAAVGSRSQLATASGDVSITASAGDDLTVSSASGDIHAVTIVDGRFRTASGDIRVDRVTAGASTFNAVSGDVTVGVAAGAAVRVDAETISGELRSEISLGDEPAEPTADDDPSGAAVSLHIRTVNGDVRIVRASAGG